MKNIVEQDEMAVLCALHWEHGTVDRSQDTSAAIVFAQPHLHS